MGVWKRAGLYLVRKRGRSLILLFMLSVAGIFLLAGMSVRMGADAAAEDVRKSMTSGLKLQRIYGVSGEELYTSTFDENGLEVVDAKANLFTETHMKEVLRLDGVSGYYIQFSGTSLYTGLNLQPGYNSDNMQKEKWIEEIGVPKNRVEEEEMQDCLKSCKLNSQVMGFHPVIEGKWEPSFRNGSLTLVEGRNIAQTDEKKTVISEVIAKKNHLGIGDVITVRSYDPLTSEPYGNERELEIVGIFRINFKQAYSDLTFEDEMIENIAFTDRGLRQWSKEEYHMHYSGKLPGYRVGKALEEIDNTRIFVDDPRRLPEIREQIFAMEGVDWQYYEIEMDDADYQVAAKPLLFIKNLFGIFLVVLFGGILLILSLVLSMWIKSRTHEIGILTSIGVRKKEILFQILLECCLVAAASFLLAGAVYRPVTRAVSDVTAQVFRPAKGQEDYKLTYDMSTGTFEINREVSEPIHFEYGITGKTVGWIFFALLLTALLAAFRSTVQITRQKPDALLRL